MDTMTRAAKVSRIQAQGGARQGRLLGKLLPLLPVLLAGLVGTGCSSVRAMDAPRPAEVDQSSFAAGSRCVEPRGAARKYCAGHCALWPSSAAACSGQ